MDEPDSPSNPLDAIAGVVPPAAQGQLKDDANAVVDQAQATVEAVKHEASEQISTLLDQSQEQLAEATHKAKSFATEQKDAAGNQLGGIADAISKVADELQSGDQQMVAGYARELAGGMKSVSDSVKTRNVDELIAMAEDLGRRQPLAFLGAAALAGFVASRFVLASAQRREDGAAAVRPVTGSPRPAASPYSTTTSGRGEF